MDIKINNKRILFFSFFLLSLSVSGVFMVRGINNYLAYLAYAIILSKTIYSFIKNRTFRRETLTFGNFLIVLALLIGIIVQNMNHLIKIRLILTMLIIINFAIFSRGIAIKFSDFRAGAHGIFLGVVFVFIIGIITGFSLFGTNNEGYLQFAFTAGFLHKNIFGFIVLSSFSVLLIYWKFISRKKTDFFILVIEAILLLLSNARGALFLALIFFVFINLKYFSRLIKLNINVFIFFVLIVFLGVFYYFFTIIALNSGTFGHRLSGLISWLVLFGNNGRILFFGNAAEVFSGSDYVATVREMLDGQGTVEMGVLSILVKNGIIGIIGYMMIFIRAFISMNKTRILGLKLPLLALIITMVLSSLTEPYLVNSTVCYGTFSFMVLSRLTSMVSELKTAVSNSTLKKRKYFLVVNST